VQRFDTTRRIIRLALERGVSSVYAFYAITEPENLGHTFKHSLLRLRASTGVTQVLLPDYDVRDVVMGPQGVYALTDETRSDHLSGVWRTNDGGATWTVLMATVGNRASAAPGEVARVCWRAAS
jgi:hypothetical protein